MVVSQWRRVRSLLANKGPVLRAMRPLMYVCRVQQCVRGNTPSTSRKFRTASIAACSTLCGRPLRDAGHPHRYPLFFFFGRAVVFAPRMRRNTSETQWWENVGARRSRVSEPPPDRWTSALRPSSRTADCRYSWFRFRFLGCRSWLPTAGASELRIRSHHPGARLNMHGGVWP